MIDLLYIVVTLTIGHYIYKYNLLVPKSIINNIPLTSNTLTDEDYLRYKVDKRDTDIIENPMYPPEKRVERDQLPRFNMYERTRGEPDNYQLIGLLYNNDVDKKYQLYGRRIYPGAYEWEYYVRGQDVGGLDFKVPIDPSGNNNIYNGDTVTVPTDSNTYKVLIYETENIRYIP